MRVQGGRKWSVGSRCLQVGALAAVLLSGGLSREALLRAQNGRPVAKPAITGFRDPSAQHRLEEKFLAVPSPQKAEQHLLALCSAPHAAGSLEDRRTADYVAARFREAGLKTRIDEYRVWFNYPLEVRVEMLVGRERRLIGPSRERVEGDPYQDDGRIMVPFMGGSPSGDVQGETVYVNYGRRQDYQRLAAMGISVKGKIVVVRYGKNFRGVKAELAQQNGAAGVILYSDPIEDGYFQGEAYPRGSFRPEKGVQRGSVQLMYRYPGDPTTPGFASVPDLPDAKRIPPEQAANLPRIPVTPLSYGDITPVLRQMKGPETPRTWQGALPFTYHVGPGPVVRLRVRQDYRLRTIWNVIGVIEGSEYPEQWVIAGAHRDAWEFGASDPGSGSAAMLEAVRGIGELLASGWRPRRTMVFASWDAEEQGLIGSTEFAEQYAAQLSQAAAYFNMDIAVSGPVFGASTVPSLRRFLAELTRAVPSASGEGTVFDSWRSSQTLWQQPERPESFDTIWRPPAGMSGADIVVGELGSGSDYTAFLQHLGIPASDIGSAGANGVYHSVFDNPAWFKRLVDPEYLYEQQMARLFGLQVLRMAEADVLPLDYEEYATQIRGYLDAARRKATAQSGWNRQPDFGPALQAAQRFAIAGKAIKAAGEQPSANAASLNRRLLAAERALLLPEGLPRRPWYRHAIFAPAEESGYEAATLPGVTGAIERGDLRETETQLQQLTQALERAAKALTTFQ